MAKKKCYKCQNTFNANEMTQVLKHWLCPDCYPKYINSVEYAKEKFIDDVWQLYDNKPNYPQLVAQADSFVKRYGFSYQGMSMALKYYLMDNEWNTKYLLHQAFPQAYYDAVEIYTKQERLRNSLANYKKPESKTMVARTVSYKPPLPL